MQIFRSKVSYVSCAESACAARSGYIKRKPQIVEKQNYKKQQQQQTKKHEQSTHLPWPFVLECLIDKQLSL